MKKVIVTDIDGTLIFNKKQKTIDKTTGKRYSPKEWEALGPDRYNDMSRWDFSSEWEDRQLNTDSILHSEVLQENIDLLDEYRSKGYDVKYLTARGGGNTSLQHDIDAALSQRLGYDIKGYALGDYEIYGRDKLPVKKQNILMELSRVYDEVVFMDDEEKNLELAKNIGAIIIHALRNRG